MRINKAGIDLIKDFEGFRPTPYFCPAGKPTIGYGHVIQKHETFPEPIAEKYASELLGLDLHWREKTVDATTSHAKVKPNQNQFSALVSFLYNVGEVAYKNSTLLRYVNAGLLEDAADEFLQWCKFHDPSTGKMVESKGLMNRRKAERELFLKEV